jgi:cytochrome b6-f complex subunit 7
MGGEMFNAVFLSFSLIFVGWAIGALLLKIQGVKE